MSSFAIDQHPKLDEFDLEVYFAKYEFNTKYLLCCSDAESMTMKDLLLLADEECRQMWDDLWLGYTECWGHPLLRQEVASNFYPGLGAENIRMFAGAEEGIFCVMTALLSQDDHAVVITPCYQSLFSLPKSRCAVTPVSLLPSEHWRCDLDVLRASIQANTKLIVMNWPHNPTGQVPSREHWEGILAIAKEHDLWVFSDEVYRGLEPNEALRLPTLASVYEKGLSLGVVSKSIGLAGLRVGWIAGQDQAILNAIADVKHYLSICNSAPSEVLALIALRNNDVLLNRILSIVRDNLALIDAFLERWSSIFRWERPVGGCCGFMEMIDASSISMDELAKQLVESHGVLIIPGSIFNQTKSASPSTESAGRNLSNFFRIGFGRKNFPECLEAFENALNAILKN